MAGVGVPRWHGVCNLRGISCRTMEFEGLQVLERLTSAVIVEAHRRDHHGSGGRGSLSGLVTTVVVRVVIGLSAAASV